MYLPRVVKVAAGSLDVIRRPAEGLVVLIYHRVGGRTGVRVDLPGPVFREQMAWLEESGSVVSLDEAVEGLRRGVDLRGRVAVTFDDGTADFHDDALPVLVEHRIPATLFVATAHVDEQLAFPDDGRPATWAALDDALSTGLVTIGSHTHTHALLDRLPEARIAEELDRSTDLIGARLGVAARHFAYPKALRPSAAAEAAVRARFESAAIAGTRANPAGADVHLLARTPVQTTDTARWFARKVRGGMGLEDDLRRVANRRRYAGAMR
ncbi:MAG: polysaccharide deacetylase family protein [Acidimicrobiales bacterium]